MSYRKPEVENLGDAAHVIQLLGSQFGINRDPGDGMRDLDPAYDLDE